MLPLNSSAAKPLRLRRENHSDEFVLGLAKLLQNEVFTDVTLICNGGHTIRAHRVILSLFSSYFRAIFESQPFLTNSCQHPVIVIKDLGYTELKVIIEFIYRGEVFITEDKLPNIISTAKALEVNGLADLRDDRVNTNDNADSENNASNQSTSQNGLQSGESQCELS